MARKDGPQSHEILPADVWKIAQKRLAAMSTAEQVETLKTAGILTKSGNVARPYKAVIKSR